jgi:hypothetical protein
MASTGAGSLSTPGKKKKGVFFLRTIFKDTESVSGLGWMLGCSGAGLGCCGLLRWTGKVFPLFFLFKLFCFIFWFEFTI